ncbi:MAG: hypothetical protein MSA56_03155 [Clostridium sp.]|nr:hypothetical protein [Clostridium sp.]
MKKLHELSDKAQRKAIKTVRELLSCGVYMDNDSIFVYCKKMGARFDNSGKLIMFLNDNKTVMFTEFIRDNYSRSDIINFWNKYCESEDNEEEIVYPMEQFVATFGDSFQQIFPRIIRFSVDDKYFQETDNGLIFTYADESHVLEKVINLVDLLPWLVENPQDDKMKVYIEENIKKND